jgi:Divergent InlB B-repeat domain
VTSKVEQAAAIGKGLAKGEALDPAQLGVEFDAVLGLLERLDRDGRWKEALRLARAVSTLYSLLRRWAALLRSLRAALRAGEMLDDLQAVGWAKHELGSLKLAADDVGGAARGLGEAREIRERVGDRREIDVTDHNLQTLCRRLRGSQGRERRPHILRVSLPLAILIALLLLAGGVAGGVVAHKVAAGGGGGELNPGPDGKLLRVKTVGDGSGTISSDPAGIDCGRDCKQVFPMNQQVTLTAEANDGSIFKGFSKRCGGGDTCRLTMSVRQTIEAGFAPLYPLTVAIQGAGTVRGSVGGGSTEIECYADGEGGYNGSEDVKHPGTSTCNKQFVAGETVDLSATPASGWSPGTFSGCAGTDPCRVTMDEPEEVTAEFPPPG